MSDTKEQISNTVKEALKAGDKKRVSTLRMALAEIKRLEIDSRKELQESEVQACIGKLIKQRRESIAQFTEANRPDLVEAEEAEAAILTEFMPQQMSEGEIAAEVERAVAETSAGGMADMGKVMGVLKPRLQGRADMGKASALVRAKLG